MIFLDTLIDIIFPAHCIGCNKKGEDFCKDCLYSSPSAERPTESWIFALFDYRHTSIKQAIWFLKYKNRRRIAKIFAVGLYGKIQEELADLSLMKNFREPLLIPIPLSPTRRRERGYNQAELIARELAKIDERNKEKSFVSLPDILIKTKETEHQARIKDRNTRLKNLSDSFAVKNPEKVKGRNVILLDDVTTTGATLKEARKILKRVGARNIIAFTVAH